jgi:hypothetical protein
VLVFEHIRHCVGFHYLGRRLGLLLRINKLRALVRECKRWFASQLENNFGLVTYSQMVIVIAIKSELQAPTFADILDHSVAIANARSWKLVNLHLYIVDCSLAIVLLMSNALDFENTGLCCHTAEARRGGLGDGVLAVKGIP